MGYYDFKLDTHVVSLDITSKSGSFGFNLASGFLNALGLSINVKKAELTMNMDVSRIFKDKTTIQGHVDGKQTGFSGNIGFSDIGLGFSHYSANPLSRMPRQGMINTLKNVSADIDAKVAAGKMDKWSTRVLKSPVKYPDKIVIQAGAESGLQAGDELEIFSMDHEWEGAPCQSRHLSALVDTTKPPIIVKVTENIWSSASYALVDIVNPNISNNKIRPGDYVRIHKLVVNGAPRKPLARSIKIGDITSGQLIVESQVIDWVPYMKMQLIPVITDPVFENRFVIYPDN